MGFFEESFATAGRTLDALLEAVVDACKQRGDSDFFQRLREQWLSLRDAFEGEEARGRRIAAYAVMSGVALLVGVLAIRSVTGSGDLPPLTESQQLAKDAAMRQLKLQTERDKAFASVKAKTPPRPVGQFQSEAGAVRPTAR